MDSKKESHGFDSAAKFGEFFSTCCAQVWRKNTKPAAGVDNLKIYVFMQMFAKVEAAILRKFFFPGSKMRHPSSRKKKINIALMTWLLTASLGRISFAPQKKKLKNLGKKRHLWPRCPHSCTLLKVLSC